MRWRLRCTGTREDEYSYVVRGRLGALLGDDVVFANPGDYVFKPRNQWHSFWNACDEPTSIIEIISPGGFEQFFLELSDLGGATAISTATLQELCHRYGLEMNLESVPDLVGRFDLRFPGEPVPLQDGSDMKKMGRNLTMSSFSKSFA